MDTGEGAGQLLLGVDPKEAGIGGPDLTAIRRQVEGTPRGTSIG